MRDSGVFMAQGDEYQKDIAAKLAALVRSCEDGAAGYETAAADVALPAYRDLLLGYAGQRAMFAQDLAAESERLGTTAPTEGSVGGVLHRGWLDVKAALTGNDEHAILASCVRAEGEAIKAYEAALSTRLPSRLETLLRRQYADVKEAYDVLSRLRGSS